MRSGYWDGLVDSPGVQDADALRLKQRYFNKESISWSKEFQALHLEKEGSQKVKQSLSQPVFWQAKQGCPVNGEEYGEAIGAYVDGSIDGTFDYGFTLLVCVSRAYFVVTAFLRC